MQQTTVDVRVLQKAAGPRGFSGRSDWPRSAMPPIPPIRSFFWGLHRAMAIEIPREVLPPPAEAHPRFFYLRYENAGHAFVPAEIPGVITPETNLPLQFEGSGGPASAWRVGQPRRSGRIGRTGGQAALRPRPPPAESSGSGRSGGRGRGGGTHRLAGAGLTTRRGTDTTSFIAAMRRLKGKTLTIHTPADLAKAIRKIEGER